MEAGCGLILQRFRCTIDHGIGESTGGRDDGNRSVSQAVQLVESTRFIVTRHDKDIACRLNLMSQLIAKAKIDAKLPRVLCGKLVELGLDLGVATAKDDPLRGTLFSQMLTQHG